MLILVFFSDFFTFWVRFQRFWRITRNLYGVIVWLFLFSFDLLIRQFILSQNLIFRLQYIEFFESWNLPANMFKMLEHLSLNCVKFAQGFFKASNKIIQNKNRRSFTKKHTNFTRLFTPFLWLFFLIIIMEIIIVLYSVSSSSSSNQNIRISITPKLVSHF